MRTSRVAVHKARLLQMELAHMQTSAVTEAEPRPEMLCFRGQTLALVRHFFEISAQVGRVSSLLGREFFRARVTHHAIPSFEEQAVFVRDIELCLSKLGAEHARVLTLLGLYDYSYDEVSRMMHCSRTLARQWFSEALDCLSEIFLDAGLLRESEPDRRQRQLTRNHLPADATAPPKKPPCSVQQLPPGHAWAGEGKEAAPARGIRRA